MAADKNGTAEAAPAESAVRRAAGGGTSAASVYVIERRLTAHDLVAGNESDDPAPAEAVLAQLAAVGGAWVYVGEAEATRGGQALERVLEGIGLDKVVAADYRAVAKRYIGDPVPAATEAKPRLVIGKPTETRGDA
jgi:hypothetical protein